MEVAAEQSSAASEEADVLTQVLQLRREISQCEEELTTQQLTEDQGA